MLFENVNYFTKGGRLRFGSVSTENGRIRDVRMQDESYHAGARFLLPGCIDMHTHAMLGSEYFGRNAEAAAKARRALAKSGTTSFLFATMALSEAELIAQCARAGKAAELCKPSYDTEGESRCLGVYLEGPFLSYEKKGAHDAKYLHLPDKAMLNRLNQAANGGIKAVCMAPELEGAIELANDIKNNKIVSLAHSAADYDASLYAFKNGFSNLTHTFNAMQPMLHRAPGPVAAAYESEGITAEFIGDGVHIKPAMLRILFRLFTYERLILISDSISVCGMADGVYTGVDGQSIRLENGMATIDGTGTIAGSAMPMFAALKRLISFGIPAEEAIATATINPAKRLGIENKLGAIEEGFMADMLLCSAKLDIEKVFISGKEI